jgi:hypothetical protein
VPCSWRCRLTLRRWAIKSVGFFESSFHNIVANSIENCYILERLRTQNVFIKKFEYGMSASNSGLISPPKSTIQPLLSPPSPVLISIQNILKPHLLSNVNQLMKKCLKNTPTTNIRLKLLKSSWI